MCSNFENVRILRNIKLTFRHLFVNFVDNERFIA